MKQAYPGFLKIMLLCTVLLTTGVHAQKKTSFVLGETLIISSKVLRQERTLNIYLPEGYHPDSSKTYPVVYLLDGAKNEDFIHIAGLMQFLVMTQQIEPAIIVGIANVDRKHDLTFPTSIGKDKKDFPTTGGSAAFIRFLDSELRPLIERNYRTNERRLLIGQSLGGLLATEILLHHPQMFTDYLIVSPSIWWNDSSVLKKPGLKNALPHTQVFVSVGTEGPRMEKDAAQLVKLLNDSPLKKNTYFEPLPGEDHRTILHRAAYLGLIRLLGAAKTG